MHFYYLDETGCTGTDLANEEQPVFVLGGLSLRDEGWNRTCERFESSIKDYFNGPIPPRFELHGWELLSPDGDGPFDNHPIEDRTALVDRLLSLVEERKHGVHYLGIDKARLQHALPVPQTGFATKTPYLLALDYLITYINQHVKEHLSHSARGMFIIDHKDEFAEEIREITELRRFCPTKSQRVKWIVEYTNPVASHRNPLVQLSDLVIIVIRRFLEIYEGYRENWPDEVKLTYGKWYARLHERLWKKSLVERTPKSFGPLNSLVREVAALPKGQWKKKLGI